MARKLQQFLIFKFTSKRLKDKNYNLRKLSIDQARLNGELIAISDSQLIRTLHKIENRVFVQSELDEILGEKKRVVGRKNSVTNRKRISEINQKIDSLLFLDKIISVQFDDRRHFRKIIDRGGIKLNGKHFVYFMASAGQTRRDTCLFIDETIKDEITNIFNNGRDVTVPIVPQKFAAYYSLFSSSSLSVSAPRIAVVPATSSANS